MEELSYAKKLRFRAEGIQSTRIDKFVSSAVDGCIAAVEHAANEGVFTVSYTSRNFPAFIKMSDTYRDIEKGPDSDTELCRRIKEALISKGLNEVSVYAEYNRTISILCSW